MANELEYVRRSANIKPTPRNKGVKMTIEVEQYDNGLIEVNGSPIRGKYNPGLSAMRLIGQMMEELHEAHLKRKSGAPAEALSVSDQC